MAAAIDTNILVRFLTGDDPEQAAIAADRLRQGFLLVPTVLVETEWVLRASYKWARGDICAAFRDIADMPQAIGLPETFSWALDRFAEGADFADMLHLSLSVQADAFLTFDRRIERAAGNAAPVTIMTLA